MNNRFDICIHLAAQISVTESIRSPKKTADINVNGTRNILRSCVKYDVKNFVFASSSAVYGNSVRLPLSEDETPNPISPYGTSKLKAEELVLSYSKTIPRAIALRFFNIYGKGQTPEYAGVITKFAKRLSAGLPPVIFGSGKQTRDFVSVEDVVRAILLAAKIERRDVRDKPRSTVNVFNIGTGKPTRITNLADMMIGLFSSRSSGSISFKNQRPIYAPSIEGDILESYADTTRSEQLLGFKYHDELGRRLKLLYV
jgi:UDP-glucose 4-epimerase